MEHIRSAGYGVDMVVGEEPIHAYFPPVEPLIGGATPRVMSLRDGTRRCRNPTRPTFRAST